MSTIRDENHVHSLILLSEFISLIWAQPSKSNLFYRGTTSSFRDQKYHIVDSKEVSEGSSTSSISIDSGGMILFVQVLVYQKAPIGSHFLLKESYVRRPPHIRLNQEHHWFNQLLARYIFLITIPPLHLPYELSTRFYEIPRCLI